MNIIIRLTIFIFITIFSYIEPIAKSNASVLSPEEQYSYYSQRFSQLVSESYKENKSDDIDKFHAWMEQIYENLPQQVQLKNNKVKIKLEDFLKLKKKELQDILDIPKKTKYEIELCTKFHKFIKTIIPRYSLERGFEFYNVVNLGERQCFLQSVFIAALLQEIGLNAGVAMVYKNEYGKETNNGHAATLIKLSNKRDIIIDASNKKPFARHLGVFARYLAPPSPLEKELSSVSDYIPFYKINGAKAPHYIYVEPVYKKDSDEIQYYKSAADNKEIDAIEVKTLDFPFIQSQFWYYRGERTKGGLFATVKTKEGIETAENNLKKSIKLCPNNPLPVYMLGMVYLLDENLYQARNFLEQARELYLKSGWLPPGPKEVLESLNKRIDDKH